LIVLDTNVLSELLRPEPAETVVEWVGAQPATRLFTTTLTEAEVLYGLRLLPAGRRREQLEGAIADLFDVDLAQRILPFDRNAARAYAPIVAARRSAGRPVAQIDGQIAAIARSRGASLATRNVRDFEGCGLDVIDPWRP
jgi:hypothetical protein